MSRKCEDPKEFVDEYIKETKTDELVPQTIQVNPTDGDKALVIINVYAKKQS